MGNISDKPGGKSHSGEHYQNQNDNGQVPTEPPTCEPAEFLSHCKMMLLHETERNSSKPHDKLSDQTSALSNLRKVRGQPGWSHQRRDLRTLVSLAV